MVTIDLYLCHDCGENFDALQNLCNVFDEPMPLKVLAEELCEVCRPLLLDKL